MKKKLLVVKRKKTTLKRRQESKMTLIKIVTTLKRSRANHQHQKFQANSNDAPVAAENKFNLKTYNGGKNFECEEDRTGVSSELKPGLAGPANVKGGLQQTEKEESLEL